MNTNPQTKAILFQPKFPEELELTADDAATDADGVIAELGCNSSGFGGLGLDGMVGNVPAGAAPALPPGEGNKGIMSGANAGGMEETVGPIGRKAGAAEMRETFNSRVKEKEGAGLVMRRSVAKNDRRSWVWVKKGVREEVVVVAIVKCFSWPIWEELVCLSSACGSLKKKGGKGRQIG